MTTSSLRRPNELSSSHEVALWLLWATVVTVVVGLSVWVLHVLIDAPRHLAPWWAVGAVAFVPAIVALTNRSLRPLGGRALQATVTAGGLTLMVLAVYLVVVVGLGDDIDGSEHDVLRLSMIAGAVAVVLAGPVRSRLRELTRATRASGSGPALGALETFGARMTRAVPMDELLLQLAETLNGTIAPVGAEVWTGEGGVLERTTSVPDRGPGRIQLSGPELAAVTGARVSGTSWAAMWLPELTTTKADTDHLRVAPITHLGQLLGLIAAYRTDADGPFTPDEDGLLADIARQVGLALHNVRLDSALQRSLEELTRKNRELEASRVRIVTAADESRRAIERNLHDGAQQHLVALALKVQMAKLKAGDSAVLTGLLDDLGEEVQTTIDEVRELAHGIYPPLLREKGLGKALQRAADRGPLPSTVVMDTDRRFDPAIESAVYFCCLEAMQNAGKYAGAEAHLTVRVFEADGSLVFEVEDDGIGFDVSSVSESQGFANMRDRVGAHGGRLTVETTPGTGTLVRGEMQVLSES